MSMSISPENERVLSEMVATGQFRSHDEALAEALRILRDESPNQNGQVLPVDQWRTKFQQHVDSTPASTATVVADSQESIYEGRGE